MYVNPFSLFVWLVYPEFNVSENYSLGFCFLEGGPNKFEFIFLEIEVVSYSYKGELGVFNRLCILSKCGFSIVII
jgi:hypothetical protein